MLGVSERHTSCHQLMTCSVCMTPTLLILLGIAAEERWSIPGLSPSCPPLQLNWTYFSFSTQFQVAVHHVAQENWCWEHQVRSHLSSERDHTCKETGSVAYGCELLGYTPWSS